MPRPTLLLLFALLVTFFFGLATGLYFGGASSTLGSSTKTSMAFSSGNTGTNEAQNDLHGNIVLSTRIRELEKELAAQREKDSAAELDRVAFFKKFGNAINMQPFDGGLKVTPEMAGLLGLTDAERNKVEQDLRDIKDELGKIEDAGTKLTKQTDNSVSYEVASNKQGEDLKQKLHDMLVDDIGNDRADVFVGDGKNYSYNTSFSGFLDSSRQIEISWKSDNGTTTYTTTERSGTGMYTTSSTNFPQGYQKYLPKDMKP